MSLIKLIIEDVEIQVLAAIKSINDGYTSTAVAELNGAKLMIESLKCEERHLLNTESSARRREPRRHAMT